MEILIISGLSGSGKSKAASYLEDMGFYIVDNMPAAMILRFAEFCAGGNRRYDRVALVYDVRTGDDTFTEFFEVLDQLKTMGGQCRMLFLECAPGTIIKRYKETRRRHPLSGDSLSLEEAVRKEREMLRPLRQRADLVIDTTKTSTAQLQSAMNRLFGDGENAQGGMTVQVVSFGFKRGLPLEADLVFDVRFLPNPYYIPELKYRTGLEKDVRDYVFRAQQTHEFIQQLESMLRFLLPYYSEEGKSLLVVGIGCTGGHHRSVAIAHELSQRLTSAGFDVSESHRDISR